MAPSQTKSRFRSVLERSSNQLTRVLATRYARAYPQYYVCEYPRSGGTWFARMLADALNIARPGPSVFPIGCKAVVHAHWKYHPKLRNVFVLARDGRDVLTSYWFYRMRAFEKQMTDDDQVIKRNYLQAFGGDFDPDNPGAHLPEFIRYEFANPRGARLNWADYCRAWWMPERSPSNAYLTYEQLIEDTAGTLVRAIEHVTGEPADQHRVERAVQHYSMESFTGRSPGEEDRASFVRKGVAGDWKNHFTPEAARVFDELAGDMLIELGYEQDRQWVGRFTEEYEAN